MRKLGVTESFKLKRQVVISASEATEMILRSVLFYFCTSSVADRICAEWTRSSVQHLGNGRLIK